MSSIGDLSDTASAIGCASQLDDSNLNVTTPSLTPSSSASSISRQKSSPIWQYCRIEDGKSNPAAWVDSDGRKWWHCQPCFGKKREKRYNYSGRSSTIIDHLRKEYRIMISGRQEIRQEVTQPVLETLLPSWPMKLFPYQET